MENPGSHLLSNSSVAIRSNYTAPGASVLPCSTYSRIPSLSGLFRVLRRSHTLREITNLLSGGDRRSLGRSGEVAKLVTQNPELLPQLVALLRHDERVVAIRAADVLEKVQARLPEELFAPFKSEFVSLALSTTQPEMRWHLAQMLPRLCLSRSQRRAVVRILESYFADRSAIVRAFALQAVVNLARRDPTLHSLARERIEKAMQGSAAERARARIVLAQFFELNAG